MTTRVLDDDSTSGAARELMDQPGPQGLVVVDWAASTAQGSQRVRNEDNWGQLGPIFVVADGMGGLRAGDLASRVATQSLVSEWFGGAEPNPVQMVRNVNVRVRASLVDTELGGSTLSSIRIAHDQAIVVHVGDSRVYRLRSGQAELLTRDHNLRNELMAAGIEPRAGEKLGPLRALTSYLGMPDEELQVDVRSVALRSGDFLVLCTDGVFDGRNHAEFLEVVRRGSRSGAEAIALGLIEGTRPDDATAVVVEIGTTDRLQGTQRGTGA